LRGCVLRKKKLGTNFRKWKYDNCGNQNEAPPREHKIIIEDIIKITRSVPPIFYVHVSNMTSTRCLKVMFANLQVLEIYTSETFL